MPQSFYTIRKPSPLTNAAPCDPRLQKEQLAGEGESPGWAHRRARQVCTRDGLCRGGGIQTRQINMPSITPARRLLSSRGVSRACAASALCGWCCGRVLPQPLVGGSAGLCALSVAKRLPQPLRVMSRPHLERFGYACPVSEVAGTPQVGGMGARQLVYLRDGPLLQSSGRGQVGAERMGTEVQRRVCIGMRKDGKTRRE